MRLPREPMLVEMRERECDFDPEAPGSDVCRWVGEVEVAFYSDCELWDCPRCDFTHQTPSSLVPDFPDF